MVLVAALAFRASWAETRKMGGARPRADGRPPATKERTCRDASSFCRRSALFTTSTTFLPQSRISSRYPRSLSVRGRSAEVTNRTRSLRGTKPRLSSSWWRMIAFVPGVSTTAISRRNSLGYPFSRTPSRRSLSTGSSAWRSTVILSVVGVTPSCAISASSRAFMKALFPELNSPTMTSRNSSSRSACARLTSSTSSDGAPKSFRNPMNLSRSARSRSTRASRRSSRILIYQPSFSAHYSNVAPAPSGKPVSRPLRGGKREESGKLHEWRGFVNYRRLGRTELEVSEVGYGAWGIGRSQWIGAEDDESLRALNRAIDLGLNFLDTALAYGEGHSERLVGQVVRERTETVYVATKIPPKNRIWPAPAGLHPDEVFPADYVRECTETSLRNLGSEAIDVQQFHVWSDEWVGEGDWLGAVEGLNEEGKIRLLRVSIHHHQARNAS